MSATDLADAPFAWSTQPDAAQLISELIGDIERELPAAQALRARMLSETGTRFDDWIDHLVLPHHELLGDRLHMAGFHPDQSVGEQVWRHTGGLFPAVRLYDRTSRRIVVKVDSVVQFFVAHEIGERDAVDGDPLAPIRRGKVSTAGTAELWVIERHGAPTLIPLPFDTQMQGKVLEWGEAFRLRSRGACLTSDGFETLVTMIRRCSRDLGRARTCDLFFKAEREYWQNRNHAAQVQKVRQDRLGLGWANHDHHTYRSSREHFSRLIRILESLGFECRERFYAGAEAGWGAQVLEHPACGITVFADVDLSPAEVSGDFAHQPLPPREELGTVGLWCALHGEAILEAGMHHLECQFEFDAIREQLHTLGISTMKPFTDLPHLRQAFVYGEVWPVRPERIENLANAGRITAEQAGKFRRDGALGSHLEVLQREEGYKGFNQTGINEIIRDTDPRRQA
ncbi:MAG: hypothetical protein KDA75_01150 [Planctomycetaceae bacterium]|nr:hypothetical protein [Planctomycetaceae bacterium]